MSNSYTKAAFGLAVTSAEADMLRRVVEAVDLIADRTIDLNTLERRYPALGDDFAALFPRTADSPFYGLLDLFPDINFPSLDFTIDFGEPDDTGQVILVFSGENFGLETAARLIQRCARSALPFGFEWSSDCDALRIGEFGGGYVVITEADIEYWQTSAALDRAIARTRDEGADGFVLTIRDRDRGLRFWNDEEGFGRLLRARVFSEAEAANHDLPIVHEWMAMPPPLRA